MHKKNILILLLLSTALLTGCSNGLTYETEIRKIGGRFYLLTKEKYENPNNPGTDGYAARMRIIELGAGYVSPPGHDSFGAEPFYDAYGMKSRD